MMISPKRDQANRLLFHAVCSPYMEDVISAGQQVFGRPVMFIDEYFHLVNLAPEAPQGMPLWDEIFRNKALPAQERETLIQALEESKQGACFLDQPGCRVLLAPILLERRNRGYLLVFWDGAPPEPLDYELM